MKKPFDDLIIDSAENGKLAGDFLAMAQRDMTCAEVIRTCAQHRDHERTPEEQVCAFLNRLWADPNKDTYLLTAPLVPSRPLPGQTIEHRIRNEVARCFAALGDSYLPVCLSSFATTRKNIRHTQLAGLDAGYASLYFSTLEK